MKKSSSTNADQQHNNNSNSERQLLTKKPIEDTPFTAVKFDDKWFLTMGKYRLTEPINSEEEVTKEAYSTTWHRIMQIIQIMIDEDRNANKKTEQQIKAGLLPDDINDL